MNALRGRVRRLQTDTEAGFTLIEVVVATTILAVLATASLAIYVASLDAAASMQRRQVAITIANESLESASSWTVASDSNGMNNLVRGRDDAAVIPVWMHNIDAEGVSQTNPEFDDRATTTSSTAIPIRRSVERNGTTYTVDSLVGTCYQPATGGDCVLEKEQDSAELTRVMIIVNWRAGDSCPAPKGCSYQATTLVDANADLEWDTLE